MQNLIQTVDSVLSRYVPPRPERTSRYVKQFLAARPYLRRVRYMECPEDGITWWAAENRALDAPDTVVVERLCAACAGAFPEWIREEGA